VKIKIVQEHLDIVLLESVYFCNILILESMLGYGTEERYLRKRIIVDTSAELEQNPDRVLFHALS
jgi:hypothetical protein